MNAKKIESNHKPSLIIVLLLVVLVLWCSSWYIIINDLELFGTKVTSEAMFSAVSSLFSGLAFGGLIYAIYLQSKELSLQRKELEDTRLVLEGQKEQLEKQNVNITKQNFEITFFNMLQNIQSIVNNMVDPHGNKIGRNYLHDLFESFEIEVTGDNNFKTIRGETYKTNIDNLKNVIISFYNKKFQSHSYNLGHYFRTIHNLLKLIENEFDSKESRLKYASILQSQLSNDELGFILYNSLSDYSHNKDGKPEFRRMIDELNILENIDEKCVFDIILTLYFPNTNFFFSRKKDVLFIKK